MKQNAQLMPMISVDSVDHARNFYVESLGFSHLMGMLGKDGQLDFCTVTSGGAKIMLMRAPASGSSTEVTSSKRPVELYLEISDVNGYHDELAAKGIEVTNPLTDQWWGDRTFTVMDPFGYQIWFFQTVADPIPPKGAKLV